MCRFPKCAKHVHVQTVWLQVETFGSMEREEKVQFILEQMRLGLARKDYIRTQIISKKISAKFFSSSSDSDVVQVRERWRVCTCT